MGSSNILLAVQPEVTLWAWLSLCRVPSPRISAIRGPIVTKFGGPYKGITGSCPRWEGQKRFLISIFLLAYLLTSLFWPLPQISESIAPIGTKFFELTSGLPLSISADFDPNPETGSGRKKSEI